MVDGIGIQLWRAGRSECHTQAKLVCVLYEGIDVRPVKRVTACDNEQWLAEFSNLPNQFEPFGGRQLVRVAFGLGLCTAVFADEVARPGDFPDGDKRRLVEIEIQEVWLHQNASSPRSLVRIRRITSFEEWLKVTIDLVMCFEHYTSNQALSQIQMAGKVILL